MTSLCPALLRRRVASLLPWLLLWVAAPAPLWLALGMSWWMRRG